MGHWPIINGKINNIQTEIQGKHKAQLVVVCVQ